MSQALLSVKGLEAGYAGSQVLFGVNLEVGVSQVVSLMVLLRARAGEVCFGGRVMTDEPPFRIAQAGIGLVPEGRQIFPTLTVEENLVAIAANRSSVANAWTLERVYAFFPRLAERRRNFGDQISGGEQQMLAIGRALMTNPKLLILDEATEGLAPLIRQEIWERLAALKREGLAILIIDKNVEALLRLSDRHLILEKGRIVWSGSSAALAADPVTRDRYLSV